MKYKHVELRYKNHAFDLLVADTFYKLMLGLMKLKRIGKSEGMLFVFGRDARHGIWMLNMQFAIDIIWLDKEFTVVDIASSAKPCKSVFKCTTYLPIKDARYVVELNAGEARKMGLRTGAKLKIKSLIKNQYK
ncbi:MAG: DUF192 domain-containing protein [Candidatus Micrarchaeia archaeon]